MTIYVTYLTSYSGSKLPPFYIGSTSLDNFNSGYLGSVVSKRYKDIWNYEIKNNLHLFKSQIISKHITRKEAYEKESTFHKLLRVTKNNLYINQRIANTLNFTPKAAWNKGLRYKRGPTNSAGARCSTSNKSLGSISLDDPRWTTGEIVSIIKGRVAPNKGTKQSKEYIEKRMAPRRGKPSKLAKSNHPLAKTWKLIMTNGEIHVIKGDLTSLCDKLQINKSAVYGSANKGPIPPVPHNYCHKNNPIKLKMRESLVGIIVESY